MCYPELLWILYYMRNRYKNAFEKLLLKMSFWNELLNSKKKKKINNLFENLNIFEKWGKTCEV